MLSTLRLLLPALVPSWRFFDTIGASPRIQYAILGPPWDTPLAWRPFRPIPPSISPLALLGRVVWNPAWNESLYLLTCAERVLDDGDLASEGEILQRVARDLTRGGPLPPGSRLAFRLLLVDMEEGALREGVAFRSRAVPVETLCPGGVTP